MNGAEKPGDDQMRGGTEDLVGEIATMAEDPDSDEAEILERLARLADSFSPDEVFAVLARFDTPDLLG
ncbi:hypothetical protein [Catenuloplanes japonicus]|uniref:hypothetical protein n=1 Tax=Catenuloplanes japonicus TaxID=33876 RepID=UPI000524D904|nr:hypothetical protein [Catenuloplanes japonicus]